MGRYALMLCEKNQKNVLNVWFILRFKCRDVYATLPTSQKNVIHFIMKNFW